MSAYQCSRCGGELPRGRVMIAKNLLAKLSWPFPSDRLIFAPDQNRQNNETIIRQGAFYEAFTCEACGSLLLTRQKWSAVEPAG